MNMSRREFLAWGAALASGAVACSKTASGSSTQMTKPLTDLSAIDAVNAMRKGDLSAEDYANALLKRCEQGKHLNAFITLDPERVLNAARAADQLRASGASLGPLHGLPIPVKDSVNTKDYPTTGGTPALRNFQPAEAAGLVDRLVSAGAIVMGKTNIHELSWGWTSNNLAFGAVRNPYDITRIPGGSSGGTAAAVAAGLAPLGVAEDTQGSIRVPAALCGICGFRPTTGRYPNDGVIPITPLFDQVGPHARTVADLALFDNVITGEPMVDSPMPLKGTRLGVPREYFFNSLDSEVERIVDGVLEKLADAGAILVEADVPELARLIELTTNQVQLYHVMPMLKNYLRKFDTGVTFDELLAQASTDIQTSFSRYVLPGSEFAVSEAAFIAARDQYLPALRQTQKEYFQTNNLAAMVFPTTQITATRIGQDTDVNVNGKVVSFEAVISRNISPGSTSGLPGLVLPAALSSKGLPISIELDSPEGSDRSLLGLGLTIERVLGRLPPPEL